MFNVLIAILLQAAAATAPSKPTNPIVVLETTMGDITIELLQDRAPVSVENFLNYAKTGAYDGTIFHRVERGFVVQGGGYTPDLERRATRPPIKNEATNGLRNRRGTVAMARSSQVRSATSEFFINVNDNGMLDHKGLLPDQYGYAVFGRVLDGMDVVDKISGTPVQRRGPHGSVPVTPVVITKVRPK